MTNEQNSDIIFLTFTERKYKNMEKLIQYRTNASLYDGAFDSTVGWAAAGMGDVIVTENNKLIVVDGGFGDDAEGILSLLEANSADEIPHVDLWMITHPHFDHYGALKEISNNESLRPRVTVGRIVYWFPMEFCGKDGSAGALAKANEHMAAVCKAFGAEYHRPSLDEKIVIDGMEFHFLYVPDDCTILNTGGGNANLCSLIFTVKGKNRKAMITGDAYSRSMQMTVWRYHKKLKCDILQMPHHGLCDSYNIEFYREIDAKSVLIPISVAGYRTMHSDMYADREGRNHNIWAENNAEEVFKAFEGIVTIEL